MLIHNTDEEPGYIEEDGLEVEGEADPLVILVVPAHQSGEVFKKAENSIQGSRWQRKRRTVGSSEATRRIQRKG